MSNESRRTPNVPRNLKGYFLCLLKKGPRWNEAEGSEELMPQHLAFLREQTEARKFLITGPVTDDADDLVGITILEAANRTDAIILASLDPAVQAGRLKAEIRSVYLPALSDIKVEY
ncbi:YciI family protein [Silvibacterium acidisoli]|uniref:YciI family protein n=1 Tax=Acidobacteriaceae bacterium ZG23-2 TaxID=2883246 RepID=UPI00406C627E